MLSAEAKSQISYEACLRHSSGCYNTSSLRLHQKLLTRTSRSKHKSQCQPKVSLDGKCTWLQCKFIERVMRKSVHAKKRGGEALGDLLTQSCTDSQ